MEIENARKADKSILFQIVFDGILLFKSWSEREFNY